MSEESHPLARKVFVALVKEAIKREQIDASSVLDEREQGFIRGLAKQALDVEDIFNEAADEFDA